MLPDLREIKQRRVAAGLTQSSLSEISSVSQSLIAKIEAGKIEPSYAKAKRLFDCLTQLHAKQEKLVKDAMTRPVVSVEESESLKSAIRALEKHGLSQLPVLSKEKPVGSITERGILGKINSSPGLEIERARVEEAMEEALPTIQENTPVSVASQLLSFNSAVLVVKKGKIAGILTKSDLLKQMIK
ncbi:MAG: CBS domain-containing protein [Candidatus Diapherotrites archaeon]|uniref:CBS domain-containing protein n=1 Tax=Candidatus Iainarchaeum sp. TaxID=3101447 RepID=A0A938YVU2_9ARCH|nr:CBS domain-containing protein [Candidatus Diapherotrites archaeon]